MQGAGAVALRLPKRRRLSSAAFDAQHEEDAPTDKHAAARMFEGLLLDGKRQAACDHAMACVRRRHNCKAGRGGGALPGAGNGGGRWSGSTFSGRET